MKTKQLQPLDLEKLSELEHEQWVGWSKQIAKTENISKKRLRRWKKLWVNYKFLTEKEKESDRDWARKVIKLIKSACEFYLRYKDKPELLKKEFPTSLKVGKKEFGAEDELNNFLRIIKEKITFLQGFEIEIFKQKYNDWLFKLAFKDVLENENKNRKRT